MMMATRWFAKHPVGLCLPPGSTRTLLFFLNADSSSSIEVGGTLETFFLPPYLETRICVELFQKPAYALGYIQEAGIFENTAIAW